MMMSRPLRRALSSVNYDSFLSSRPLARRPSAIRALQPLLAEPGMISLGGGMPHPETFPFESMSVTLKSGKSFELAGESLNAVLQYGATCGSPGLVAHLEALQVAEHGAAPPSPHKICVTTGSQAALAMAFDLFTGGGADEAPVLVESPTYSGSLAYLQPTGTELVGVACDADGMDPVALDRVLRQWDASRTPRPKVLYTIPVGGNPTGASLSLERKKRIYQLAREFDLVILEDDPYYWMQYGSYRVPSFLSLDVDGRVLRFDSFSKLVSSGLRVGFCTGPAPLVERIELHAQASVLHGSGVSQALVAGLFDAWEQDFGDAYEGFVRHCRDVSAFYEARKDHFLACADKHLAGVCEWSEPSAGMFVWMKWPVDDTDAFIKSKCQDAKVLLVPGQSFDPHDKPSQYARAAFSTASFDDIDTALQRLGNLLRQAQASPSD